MRSIVLAASLVTFAALAGGCCTTPPPPDKFFDRTTATETLKGFVYSVDIGNWDYAYASLTQASRREMSSLKFRIVIQYLKDPVFGTVPIYDLISESVRSRTPEVERNGRRLITVLPTVRDSSGNLATMELPLVFLEEEGEVRLDFLETLEKLQHLRDTSPPPTALSTR